MIPSGRKYFARDAPESTANPIIYSKHCIYPQNIGVLP